MAEITGLSAQRQHEIVVVQPAVFQLDAPPREIETGHLMEQHGDVAPAGEDAPDGLRDFGADRPHAAT